MSEREGLHGWDREVLGRCEGGRGCMGEGGMWMGFRKRSIGWTRYGGAGYTDEGGVRAWYKVC